MEFSTNTAHGGSTLPVPGDDQSISPAEMKAKSTKVWWAMSIDVSQGGCGLWEPTSRQSSHRCWPARMSPGDSGKPCTETLDTAMGSRVLCTLQPKCCHPPACSTQSKESVVLAPIPAMAGDGLRLYTMFPRYANLLSRVLWEGRWCSLVQQVLGNWFYLHHPLQSSRHSQVGNTSIAQKESLRY